MSPAIIVILKNYIYKPQNLIRQRTKTQQTSLRFTILTAGTIGSPIRGHSKPKSWSQHKSKGAEEKQLGLMQTHVRECEHEIFNYA